MNTNVIGLAGMTGVGKSTQSKGLKALGYRVEEIDHRIALELARELEAEGLPVSTKGVGLWIRMPYDPLSPARQQRYLEIEDRVTLATLQGVRPHERVAIDFTGSLVHLSDETKQAAQALAWILYLMSANSVDTMFRIYIAEKNPVYYGPFWKPLPGETNDETVARCYRKLLEWRVHEYPLLAHQSIPYEVHRAPDFNAQKLLEIAGSHKSTRK